MNAASGKTVKPRKLDRHKALAHPLRREIMAFLITNSSGSPSQMHKKLDASLSDISYHCRQLVRYGAADLAETRPVKRGSPERIYVPALRPLLTTEDGGRRTFCPRASGVRGPVCRARDEDLRRGFSCGAFAKRADWVAVRNHLELDKQGHQRLIREHEQFLERSFEIQAESDARRVESGEPTTRVANSQLCFALCE
jgi:hypothetical protein